MVHIIAHAEDAWPWLFRTVTSGVGVVVVDAVVTAVVAVVGAAV